MRHWQVLEFLKRNLLWGDWLVVWRINSRRLEMAWRKEHPLCPAYLREADQDPDNFIGPCPGGVADARRSWLLLLVRLGGGRLPLILAAEHVLSGG